MGKCKTCGKKDECKNEYVNTAHGSTIRLKVCDVCMQLLLDGNYKELTKRGKKGGLIE